MFRSAPSKFGSTPSKFRSSHAMFRSTAHKVKAYSLNSSDLHPQSSDLQSSSSGLHLQCSDLQPLNLRPTAFKVQIYYNSQGAYQISLGCCKTNFWHWIPACHSGALRRGQRKPRIKRRRVMIGADNRSRLGQEDVLELQHQHRGLFRREGEKRWWIVLPSDSRG